MMLGGTGRRARGATARVALLLGGALLGPALLGACDGLVGPSLSATVTAVITRRDSVTPIKGARVLLYTGQRPMGYATSDDSGRVTFLDVPEGVYGVRSVPPTGYLAEEALYLTPTPTEFVHNIQLKAHDSVGVRFTFLKEGPGRITVQVNDPAGRGIPDIGLALYAPKGTVERARTDAQGRAAFDPVPFGNYGVFAERPVIYRDSGETALVPRDGLIVDEGSTQRALFTLAPCGGSVVAEVKDQQGRPAPGTVILYQGTSTLQQGALAADGTRTFGGLLCDLYGLRYLPPAVGWRAAEVRGAAYADGLRLRRTSGTLRATLVVEKYGWGRLRLRVVDQLGAAVPPMRAVVYTGNQLVADAQLDSSGVLQVDSLRADLPYGVRIVPPVPYGYRLNEARGESYLDQVTLQDATTREVTLRLQRLVERGSIRVTVVDDANAPVRDARVVVYISSGLVRDLRTDAAGVISATDLVAGQEHGVRVVPPAGYTVTEGAGLSFVDGVVLRAGEQRALTFRLTRR
jgi:hypothetical protein